MSEVRLVVRDAERDWSGNVHGGCAERAVAALSADPVTLDELTAAVARFEPPASGRGFFGNLSRGLDDRPYDAGLVVIDLIARLVAVDSTYSHPGSSGCVEYHDGACLTPTQLPYHLADDWLFLREGYAWRYYADQRRQERAARPLIDARDVFYGRPLLEFIGRECFAAFSRRDEIAAAVRAEWLERARRRTPPDDDLVDLLMDGFAAADDGETHAAKAARPTVEDAISQTQPGGERYLNLFGDTLSAIHAAWMLTPRADLGDVSPREFAFTRLRHIDRDLSDRSHAWSLLDACPPGLAESSHAYRLGGFGTHELVKYYDLVRELLWSCWERLSELSQSPQPGERPDALLAGDFLTFEVPRLAEIREAWLDEPDPECHGRTPRSIIRRERARLPEGLSGHEAMVDPDCPCCQMLADLPGPVFWHLDGCNMDDDFAFDLSHATREEWEAERREWDERSRRFDAERAERKRLGVTDPRLNADGTSAVWSRSFAIDDTADVPLGIRVFGLGARLAEVIADLRAGAERDAVPPAVQAHIDLLNRDFGNLRELLQSPDESLAATLLDPVCERFRESLDAVAAEHAHLADRCSDLARQLISLADPPEPPTESYDDEDNGDDGDEDDVPF